MRFLTAIWSRALLIAGLVACVSCEDAPPAEPVRLAIDGRSNANPSIAARDEVVAVAWSASTSNSTDVYAAVSRDAGRTFGPPVRVNDIPGDARINSELPPRVALVPKSGGIPELVVVWSTRREKGTRLQSARSTDAGATFSAAVAVPGTAGPGSRGWQSAAVDSAGNVLVMWLDHRDVPPDAAAHHHGGSPASPAPKASGDAPTARAAFSKLYFASLADRDAQAITGGVCYCCKTSLVASGSNVYGVWRHVYPGSVRDIAFTMSRDGGRSFTAPVRVSEDGWGIDGCPENGPTVAVDEKRNVHVAWVAPPDGKSDTPLGLFYTASADGAPFGKRVAMPTNGPAAHAELATAGDGSLVVVWDEIGAGAKRHVAVARIRPGGGSVDVERLWTDGTIEGGWPVVATAGKKTVVGWVSGSGTSSAIVVSPIR
jgi:hypothetical protein